MRVREGPWNLLSWQMEPIFEQDVARIWELDPWLWWAYFHLLGIEFCVRPFWKEGYGNLRLQRPGSTRLPHRVVADNVLEVEVERDNRERSGSQGAVTYRPGLPAIRQYGETVPVYIYEELVAYLTHTVDQLLLENESWVLPSTHPFGPSTMKSRKQFVVCE